MIVASAWFAEIDTISWKWLGSIQNVGASLSAGISLHMYMTLYLLSTTTLDKKATKFIKLALK